MRVVHVECPEQALKMIEQVSVEGEPAILSKVPVEEFFDRLGRVRHAALDFDHTMTVGTHQWPHVSAALREQDQRFEKEYVGRAFLGAESFYGFPDSDFPLIDRKNETQLDLAVWQAAAASRSITLMAREGATRNSFRDIARRLAIREGTAELMRDMDGVSVVSWGLKPIIEAFLAHHRLEADVVSTSLLFDGEDRLIGLHPWDVVIGANKGVKAARYRRARKLHASGIWSVGDSVHDYSMMPRQGGVNMLIIPLSEADNASRTFNDGHVEDLWKVLTCVLVSDSFLPAVRLRRKLLRRVPA